MPRTLGCWAPDALLCREPFVRPAPPGASFPPRMTCRPAARHLAVPLGDPPACVRQQSLGGCQTEFACQLDHVQQRAVVEHRQPLDRLRPVGSVSVYCLNCDLLVGLQGYHVIDVGRGPEGLVVSVESSPGPVGCPDCGVLASSRGRRRHQLVDIPAFGTPHPAFRWSVRRPVLGHTVVDEFGPGVRANRVDVVVGSRAICRGSSLLTCAPTGC